MAEEAGLPDFLLGNTTNDEPDRSTRGRSVAWCSQQDDDDAVVHFNQVYVREANQFLRTHKQLSSACDRPHRSPPTKPPHETLPCIARKALLESPVRVTKKTVQFNAQRRVGPEDDREIRARLGLKHGAYNKEVADEHERRSAPIRKLDWNDPTRGEKWDEYQAWARLHPVHETDPIPEGTKRQIIVSGRNHKDESWMRHVMNNRIRL